MIGKWIRSLPFNFANINYTLTSNDSLAKGNRTYSIRTLSKLSFLITVQRVRQYISGILRIPSKTIR